MQQVHSVKGAASQTPPDIEVYNRLLQRAIKRLLSRNFHLENGRIHLFAVANLRHFYIDP